MRIIRRLPALAALTAAVTLALASPVFACGSLVAANGAVQLQRTSTLVAYHEGVEHYVTSFEFAGAPTSFGSIIPLPAKPSGVERAGDWTLQRLEREVQPPRFEELKSADAAPTTAGVEVLQQVRIDSLDVTILRGGANAVVSWATAQGFDLSEDTPAVLRFYARRSPYFMAAKFDATAAVARGFRGGDGIPVHLTIPTRNPWVPLRILATAKGATEQVDADVFLLTDREPTLLHGTGFTVERSEPASSSLLDDLRSDKSSSWVPEQSWLTYARVDAQARDLTYDLAVDVHGRTPRVADTGVGPAALGLPVPEPSHPWAWVVVGLGVLAILAGLIALTGTARIRGRARPIRG